jgi:predicted ATPase/DNA-binding CsgD family transcriptional regulator
MDAGKSHAGPLEVGAGTVTVLPRAAAPHNLPVALTSFVGRERELAELREALAETRLLTLTGPGGCGKTRLALRAGAEVLDRFPGGVWWVELAPLAGEKLVGAAVAEALGVRPLPGTSELQAACAYLASRRALVVLDNCEHLLGACSGATEAVLKAAPEVVVLATSRAPLGVGGETDWRVPPLTLPAPESSSGALAESDAVSLFVERARKVRPGFALSDGNARSVARVCGELDGLPLAIELAAARVRMLSVDQIAAGVSDRFLLLTGGARTAAERQQTLRASVDWSHDLLSVDERVLLRRVAVFAGGFTLEAAESVCAGDGIERDRVLDLLGSLVEQSLVNAEHREAGVRYRLLETVRGYGLERLAGAGEEEAVRTRHRDYYLALAEKAGPQLETGRQREWLERLDPEAANLRRAIGWAAETEPAKALRLCAALTFWWQQRGHLSEADALFSKALEAHDADELTSARAQVMWGRAYLCALSGRFETAIADAEALLAKAEQVGDEGAVARALQVIGMVTSFPDPRACAFPLRRARELADRLGDRLLLMMATGTLALAYTMRDEHDKAKPLLEELLALAQAMGSEEWVTWYWTGMGQAGWVSGEDGWQEKCEQLIDVRRASGDAVNELGVTLALGYSDVDSGQPERAAERIAAVRERAVAQGAFNLPWADHIAARALAAGDHLEEACDAFEALVKTAAGGNAFVLTGAHVDLAETRRLLGELATAEPLALQGREMAERIGNRLMEARANLVLGRIAAARSRWADADELHHRALSAIVDGGYRVELARALEGLAEVAAGLESGAEAVRIQGAAARVRAGLGLVAWKRQRREAERLEARLCKALGDHAFEEAFSGGEALSADDAVGYVRRARGERKRPSEGWESLTPTELEVARHAAAGLTNPQIGKRMFVSKATVKTHLAHIFRKLDVHSRAELTAQAVRRDASS